MQWMNLLFRHFPLLIALTVLQCGDAATTMGPFRVNMSEQRDFFDAVHEIYKNNVRVSKFNRMSLDGVQSSFPIGYCNSIINSSLSANRVKGLGVKWMLHRICQRVIRIVGNNHIVNELEAASLLQQLVAEAAKVGILGEKKPRDEKRMLMHMRRLANQMSRWLLERNRSFRQSFTFRVAFVLIKDKNVNLKKPAGALKLGTYLKKHYVDAVYEIYLHNSKLGESPTDDGVHPAFPIHYCKSIIHGTSLASQPYTFNVFYVLHRICRYLLTVNSNATVDEVAAVSLLQRIVHSAAALKPSSDVDKKTLEDLVNANQTLSVWLRGKKMHKALRFRVKFLRKAGKFRVGVNERNAFFNAVYTLFENCSQTVEGPRVDGKKALLMNAYCTLLEFSPHVEPMLQRLCENLLIAMPRNTRGGVGVHVTVELLRKLVITAFRLEHALGPEHRQEFFRLQNANRKLDALLNEFSEDGGRNAPTLRILLRGLRQETAKVK